MTQEELDDLKAYKGPGKRWVKAQFALCWPEEARRVRAAAAADDGAQD